MPVHDWSQVDAGLFHDFRQAWTIELRNSLNSGGLPSEYFALAEQIISGPIPDVVTLQRRGTSREPVPSSGGVSVASVPPQAQFIASAPQGLFARKANRIVITHRLGQVIAVIEVVSPGNKSSVSALRSFVQKAADLLREGIHLLVVDLFPPSARDPQGIHKAIWDEIVDEVFELPRDRPLTVVAYDASVPMTAYVEPFAVGDALPPLPIFLERGIYVPAPLEETYQTTWRKCPEVVRDFVENSAVRPT